jgi:hypothetical protein
MTCNVFNISWQAVVWEEILQNIERNETRMIGLDVYAQNFKHLSYMKGTVTMKKAINDE